MCTLCLLPDDEAMRWQKLTWQKTPGERCTNRKKNNNRQNEIWLDYSDEVGHDFSIVVQTWFGFILGKCATGLYTPYFSYRYGAACHIQTGFALSVGSRTEAPKPSDWCMVDINYLHVTC